jgi:FkbM family methyltransferase
MMLISPSTVLHIGAHYGQDRDKYLQLGVKRIIWGEASHENANKLRVLYPDDEVIERIFWDKTDLNLKFYNTANSENSSAIKPLDMNNIEVSSHRTVTVDDIISLPISSEKVMIVLDVQGAEMHVLNGALEVLKITDYVVLEVALKSQGYEEMPTESEVDNFMKNQKFFKSIKRISHEGSYKDQLYIKSKYQNILIKIVDQATKIVRIIVHQIRFRHSPTSQHNCDICNVAR